MLYPRIAGHTSSHIHIAHAFSEFQLHLVPASVKAPGLAPDKPKFAALIIPFPECGDESESMWLAKLEAFLDKNKSASGTDLDGAPVYLAKNAWDVGYAQEKNPDLKFTSTKERAV